MKLPVLRAIQREDLSRFGELPSWLNPFLQTLNQFMGSVGTALKGNLTFADNFLCSVKTLTFSHGVAQKINPENPKLRVIGVLPMATSGLLIDQFGWSQNTDGTINVTFNFNSATTAQCTVVLFLG